MATSPCPTGQRCWHYEGSRSQRNRQRRCCGVLRLVHGEHRDQRRTDESAKGCRSLSAASCVARPLRRVSGPSRPGHRSRATRRCHRTNSPTGCGDRMQRTARTRRGRTSSILLPPPSPGIRTVADRRTPPRAPHERHHPNSQGLTTSCDTADDSWVTARRR